MPRLGHIRTILGPCFGHKRTKFWPFLLYLCFYLFIMFQILTQILWETNKTVPCNAELLGPCWGYISTILDQVWLSFTSRPARALQFSRLSQYGLRYRFMDHVRAMYETCVDDIWPSFTSRPARALTFWRLGQHGLKPIFIKFQFSRP